MCHHVAPVCHAQLYTSAACYAESTYVPQRLFESLRFSHIEYESKIGARQLDGKNHVMRLCGPQILNPIPQWLQCSATEALAGGLAPAIFLLNQGETCVTTNCRSNDEKVHQAQHTFQRTNGISGRFGCPKMRADCKGRKSE